ncbi:MAG: PIN domain-containing protein [Betaproteobacteria bacterium]|nr:PIN domain-containing protein [Betaproteobacteria bacterium]
MSRLSLDANVLIYGVDAGDASKHRTARRVITFAAERDCVLTLQALAEFYFVATRKGKLGAMQVKMQINELRSVFPMALPSSRTLGLAIDASEQHRIGFWDGMLIAVTHEAGVGILLTEDLQDGQVYQGVRCLNPFTRTAVQLAKLIRSL